MKNIAKKVILAFAILLIVCGNSAYAQENMFDLLEEESEPSKSLVNSTFKGVRIINGHSIETRRKGTLEFLIAHRFGRLNSGAYELFGLDAANIRLGLEYALLDRVTVGVGRNSFEKTYDGFVKVKLINQSKGVQSFPLTITGFSSFAVNSLRFEDPQIFPTFTSRISYTYQFLVARKFGEAFSLQVMPTLVHNNRIKEVKGDNDQIALGVGGRFKLSKRLSLNAEYYYRFNESELEDIYNSIALGVDIETGGHVFQLHLTNSRAMIEKGFINETTGDFFSGDIHFGFNISRAF